MQKPRRLVGVAVAAALLATTFGLAAPAAGQTTGGAAASAADYPFPLPDFSHPDSPHSPQFKKHQLPPMLVVSGQFDDLTDLSESGTEDKFFPIFTFGTVSDYYLQNGLGVLVPVPETYGERDNGVVLVELGNSAGWFSQDVGVRRRTMLDLADPFVDFAKFDTNNNGRIENSELVVVTLVTSPDPTYSCGQTAAVGPGRALDGKTIAFTTADGGSLTNNLTFAHEVAHQTFDLADHYGFGVGSWDLAGPTCAGPNNPIWQAPNAWHRMHIGDDKPIVITKDRYVTMLPTDLAPYGSYLLYDPERGTDDYFMIETRRPVAGKYDQNVPDDGLMVWRVDERNVRSGLEHVRGVEMIRPDGMRTPGCIDQDVDGRTDEDPVNGRDDDGDGRTDEDNGPDRDGDGRVDEDPVNTMDDDGDGAVDEDPQQADGACYGGSDTDAWNAFDARTPQREMTANWADGTPAKVAVRAIGHTFAVPTRAMVRAFIDVRGPGILVDAAEPNGDSPHPTLTAGSTTTFSFAVMNTGEATDTFEFTELVPDGWTATTQRMTLTAGQRATATITVTAGTDELVGERHTLIARGRSTTDSSVVTEYPFLVDMNRPSAVTYTGDSTVDHSDPARLAARVTDKFSGAPLAGHKVVFSHADWLVEATTGADGVATASWPADLAPGAYTFTMSAGSKNGYTASTGTFPITVEAESATLAITSPTLYADDSGQAMTVKVTEEADGSPADLSRAAVQVQLRSALTGEVRNYSATADTNGIATVGVDAPAGLWSATVGLTGGYFTAPPIQAELVVFDPDGEVTGAAVAPDSTGRNVVLTVAARYADNAPTGAVTMTADRQTFNGTALRWLVVSGTSAVFEIDGTLNNQPATLRATVHTDGDRDRFSIKVTSATATYTSGDLTARTGALTVHTS